MPCIGSADMHAVHRFGEHAHDQFNRRFRKGLEQCQLEKRKKGLQREIRVVQPKFDQGKSRVAAQV
jgi:hypothetical protein